MTKTDLIFTLSLICCLVVRVNTSGQSQPMFTLRPDKAARFFAQQASLFYDKGNNGQTPAVKELLAAAEARNHLEEILLAGAKYLNADAKSRQAEHRLDSNKSVPSDLNLSNMCGNQTLHLLNGVSNGSMWALQMLDAWGKPPTGFFTGILNWVGDYQECIAIKSTYGKNDDPGMMLYQGRYCSGIHPSMAATGGQNVSITYQLGMCIPSGCDEHDAIVFYNTFLQYLSPESLDQTSVACQPLPGEKEFRPLTIFAYFLVCLIALISLSAGVYDYAIHGTLVYYKIHRLAVPPHLLTNGNIQNHSTSTADDANLIHNDHLAGDEESVDGKPVIYAPATSKESCGLTMQRIWLSFSCYTNGYKLLTPSQPAGTVSCLHGIRFLSLSWVILGHSLIFSMQGMATPSVILSWLDDFSFQVILNATVSVDSFFLVSGLLTSLLTLKEFSRRNIGLKDFLFTVPIMYLHRYIRLTPTLGFMILLYTYGIYNLVSGPLWFTLPDIDTNCVNNSWVPLVYINNIYHPESQCAVWTWFLANDFQFFIAAPFLIGLIYRYNTGGLIFNVVCVVTSCISAMVISYKYDLKIALLSKGQTGDAAEFMSDHWFVDYYVAPWCRYQSYGVGVIYGYILWKTNGKLSYHWVLNLLLWMVSAALCLLPLYGPFNLEADHHSMSVAESVTYNSLTRTAWSIGLGYLILACHSGRGGWINEFLSWRGFIPLSRMTYCAYLVHPVVMLSLTFSNLTLTKISYLVYAYTFIMFLVCAYAVAFVFSLLFEAPFINIDKLFITGAMKKKKD